MNPENNWKSGLMAFFYLVFFLLDIVRFLCCWLLNFRIGAYMKIRCGVQKSKNWTNLANKVKKRLKLKSMEENKAKCPKRECHGALCSMHNAPTREHQIGRYHSTQEGMATSWWVKDILRRSLTPRHRANLS